MDNFILEKINRIEQLLINQQTMQKEVLNFSEGCLYVGLSESDMYKKTSAGHLPFYKPNGKKIYFKRQDLDEWILKNRIQSVDELSQNMNNFLEKKGGNHD